MTDHTELRRLAEAASVSMSGATLMRYDHGGGRLAALDGDERRLIADFYHEADREFYAAANPQAVLALLNEIERLREALSRSEEACRTVTAGYNATRRGFKMACLAWADLAEACGKTEEATLIRADAERLKDGDWAYTGQEDSDA